MKDPQSHLNLVPHAFTVTRDLDAPVAIVYRCWTDPDHFKRWWGPHTYTNEVTAFDPHPGGKFRVVMQGADGEGYPLNGAFQELVPDQKVVITFDLVEHPAEWHAFYNETRQQPPGTPLPLVYTTIELEDLGGNRTRMRFTQRYDLPTDRDAFIEMGAVEGGAQSFVKLDSLLASLQTERTFTHFRTIAAPLALVWKAFSTQEHLEKWWGPNGFRNTFTKFDLRTGGEWRFTMHGPDGTDYPNWMSFKEVVPAQRMSYLHGERPGDPNAFEGEITFEAVGEDKTFLTLRVTVATAEMRNGFFQFGAFEGGDQTLSRLQAMVSSWQTND